MYWYVTHPTGSTSRLAYATYFSLRFPWLNTAGEPRRLHVGPDLDRRILLIDRLELLVRQLELERSEQLIQSLSALDADDGGGDPR